MSCTRARQLYAHVLFTHGIEIAAVVASRVDERLVHPVGAFKFSDMDIRHYRLVYEQVQMSWVCS